jgi:hypothetical protein
MKVYLVRSLLSLLLTSSAVCVASEAPPPDIALPGDRTPIDVEHTASIVGIQIGHRIAAFIFISKDGKHINVGADECAQSDKCQGIMAELGRAGRTDLIQFAPSHEDDTPPMLDEAPRPSIPGVLTAASSLPHRSLHEIDIQGHQSGTPGDMCPGQFRENVPETGLFLYCWGRKP